jgi:peptide/nickel transport system substrate-binding protein
MVTAQGIPDVPREDTVIFDIDGSNPTINNPFNHNWLVPGSAGRNVGYHQAVSEPLFILNYETGEIQPWLAESGTSNDTLDVWTIKLREGIEWSDGEALNADDLVYTMSVLLDPDNTTLTNAAGLQVWVDSVEKIDDLTVQFNLKNPNPRFVLDNWAVKIWGGPNILPQHVWEGQDLTTFQFFDLEKGWPLGSGPYVMVSATENEFIYDRNDNWWGAKTGWHALPEPLRLVWRATGNDDVRSLLAIDDELDSIMDITLGAFEVVNAQNPNIIAWKEQLPYAWLDPCARQMSLNNTLAPWDSADMRWALNNAMDRNQIVAIAYEGTTIPSRSLFVEYGGLIDPYINLVEENGWAMSFTADLAASAALIEGNGYALNGNGIYEKDGQELTLEIQAHEGFIEKRRIAENLVEQYRQAGIAAVQQNVAGATWEDNKRLGNFEATLDWDAAGRSTNPGPRWIGTPPNGFVRLAKRHQATITSCAGVVKTTTVTANWLPKSAACRWATRPSSHCSPKPMSCGTTRCPSSRSPRPRS